MKRRNFIKTGLAGGLFASLTSGEAEARGYARKPTTKPNEAFRILHHTDAHIRPEYQAPKRCKRILETLKKEAGKIDLILNGGDAIYAADYGNITRERVLEQWKLYDDIIAARFKGIETLSAIGNHDIWWAGPKDDPMHGKKYVLKRFGQKKRYFSAERAGWLIVVLDGNNAGVLDDEQITWLHAEMRRLPDTPMLIMSHQPLILAEHVLGHGFNARQKRIIQPFVQNTYSARPVHFISGHEHIVDGMHYKNVHFHCNGALSGTWWEPNIYNKDGCVQGTPMGYTLIDIYSDGRLSNQYYDAGDVKNGKVVI